MRQLYHALLSDPAANYGFGDHWRPVWPQIVAHAPSLDQPLVSLLDVGCGRGGLVHAAAAAGFTAIGCDLAPCEPWITEAQLPLLPYANERFDLVCCFDVLEHLPEHEVAAAIDELVRVCCGVVFLSIAECSDIREIPGRGPVELHLTRRPLDWWLAQLGGGADSIRVLAADGQPSWRHYLEVHP